MFDKSLHLFRYAEHSSTQQNEIKTVSGMTKSQDEVAHERGGIVAFRASAELIALIEAKAASEGISKSDVARRAALRDLAQQSSVAA